MSLITGCDRNTLSGLNLKINAEVKSDYEEKQTSAQKHNSTQVEAKKEIKTPELKTEATKKIVEVRETNNPDAPLAFNEIRQCSEADIIAKTNEKFYAKNAQLKSVDSKNKEQVKQWKKIYQQVEKSCN